MKYGITTIEAINRHTGEDFYGDPMTTDVAFTKAMDSGLPAWLFLSAFDNFSGNADARRKVLSRALKCRGTIVLNRVLGEPEIHDALTEFARHCGVQVIDRTRGD